MERVKLADIITETPPRHSTLPKPLMYRLLLIQESVYDALPQSFTETVKNFQRDLDPEEEAAIWELLAATYLHIVREDEIPPEGRHEVLNLALSASIGTLDGKDDVDLEHVTIARFEQVRKELQERVDMFD